MSSGAQPLGFLLVPQAREKERSRNTWLGVPDIRDALAGLENQDLHLGRNVGILSVMVLGTRVERFGVVTGLYNVQPQVGDEDVDTKKGASYPGDGKLASNVPATH